MSDVRRRLGLGQLKVIIMLFRSEQKLTLEPVQEYIL